MMEHKASRAFSSRCWPTSLPRVFCLVVVVNCTALRLPMATVPAQSFVASVEPKPQL